MRVQVLSAVGWSGLGFGAPLEETRQGERFEIDAGGSDDFRFGILDEAGADGIEQALVLAPSPYRVCNFYRASQP